MVPGTEAKPCRCRSWRQPQEKRSFYSATLSPTKPRSKSAFGRRERKWCAGVSLQKPWVKTGLGEASSEPGTDGSCKREHASERREVGKLLIKQG